MSKPKYNVRRWLNGPESEATGSVVAFHGEVERVPGRKQVVSTLEVADCQGKICLHIMPNERMQKFIKKLRLLAKVVTTFADWLEGQAK